MDTYKGVLVFTEQREGKLLDVGLELLGAGRQIADKLGQELAAVLMGHSVGALADELAAYGADKVFLVDDPALANQPEDLYTGELVRLVQEHEPD